MCVCVCVYAFKLTKRFGFEHSRAFEKIGGLSGGERRRLQAFLFFYFLFILKKHYETFGGLSGGERRRLQAFFYFTYF